MFVMSKRTGSELEEGGVVKKVKADAEHPEGSWACTSCGNVNWPKRTSCNRQGCNMPRDQADAGALDQGQQATVHPEGSWACLVCHNINWPKRTICNKESCRAPRGATSAGGRGFAGMGMGMGMGGMGAPQQLGNHPPGSWACPTCSNVNWPRRTSCNTKGCGTPRPANAGAGGAPQGAGGLGGGLLGNVGQDPMLAYYGGAGAGAGQGYPGATGGAGPYGAMGGMGGAGAYGAMGGMGGAYPGMIDPLFGMGGMGGMGGGGGSKHPPGSWACPKCNNVNWPKRTTCNSQGCDTAKPADAGMGAAMGVPQGQGIHPEGSWECAVCQNINWPKRTVCNKAGCETPRPM